MHLSRQGYIWIVVLLAVLWLVSRFLGHQFRSHNVPVAIRLVAETTAAPAGGIVTLGLVFTIAPEWHLYWRGCSDSGAPIAVKMELPPGSQAGEFLWPAPQRHISPGGILDHVYEGEVVLILPVTLSVDIPPGGTVSFHGRVDWVVCRESCEFGAAEVEIALPLVAENQSIARSASAPLIANARRSIPQPFPTDHQNIRVRWQATTLHIESGREGYLAFYPATGCENLLDPLSDGESDRGRLALRFREVAGDGAVVQGVLEWRPDGSNLVSYYELDYPYLSSLGSE